MAGLHQPLLLLLLIFSLAQTDPLRSQIVGGHEAKPHSRPYMARLWSCKFECDGFLVAPQWVMTAAHCEDTHTVILGAHNISVKENSQQWFSVVATYLHPEYDGETISNDIRLLKLNTPATLNDYVKVLPLPKSRRYLREGTPCSVAGWGLVYKDCTPDTLYETNITIYDHGQCARVYPYLNGGEICAGTQGEPEDTAQGDSGGPLVCDGVAQGIVSYGHSCPPGVYTRIGHYLQWINKTMKL